jgi:hypothetical protein
MRFDSRQVPEIRTYLYGTGLERTATLDSLPNRLD